jgi:hypothetical protein
VSRQGAPGSSQYDLLQCITEGYSAVARAFPSVAVLPMLGNHDTVVMDYPNADGTNSSAAVFVGTAAMQWLYAPVAKLWARPERIGCTAGGEFSCSAARRTLLRGGYYAARLPELGGAGNVNVTVIALNTNYWAPDNVAMSNPYGEARGACFLCRSVVISPYV